MFFTLVFSAWALAAATPQLNPSKVHEVAHGKRWQRLLHYKSHWFTGTHSTLAGPGFFFSPNGQRDPEKELLATVDAFFQRSDERFSKFKQPPACAFPARFRFLNETFQLGLKMPRCERLNEFFERFHGHDSLTLVFSTAYPNNPASMFGHSFLRINSKPEGGKPKLDLLDTGLSYAAQVSDDENGFNFVWFGLTGGYIGTFSAVPYYAKVTEYNSSESRDLWEYDLDFNQDDTWWLLANAWEVEVNSWSDYYFFDENCSYKILALIEAAKPDWDVADYLFHMIPGESVKKVTAVPGAVKNIRFRPSLFRKLQAYGDRLKSEDRKAFFHAIRGEDLDSASVPVLDTAAQYFYYIKQQSDGKLGEREAKIFQQVLLARSKRKEASLPEPIYDESSRPDLGHHASRISLGAGRQRGSGGDYGWFQEIGVKFAYHDLLNHDVGFVSYSEINFPNFSFRYFPSERRLISQKIELLSIASFSPWSWMKNSLSWRANLAYQVPQDLCSFCHVMHLEADVGISEPIAQDRLRAYQLIGIYGDAGKSLDRRWRAGPRLTIGLLANLTSRWKHFWEASGHMDPWKLGGQHRTFLQAQWGQSYFLSQAWELRFSARGTLSSDDNPHDRGEVLAQVLVYF